VGQKVEARATKRCVEIYLRQSRVASHRRQEGRGRVSTVAEHRLDGVASQLSIIRGSLFAPCQEQLEPSELEQLRSANGVTCPSWN
jgi:hypothetical protein